MHWEDDDVARLTLPDGDVGGGETLPGMRGGGWNFEVREFHQSGVCMSKLLSIGSGRKECCKEGGEGESEVEGIP